MRIVTGYHETAAPCRAANRALISDLHQHALTSLQCAPMQLLGPATQSGRNAERSHLKALETSSSIILLRAIHPGDRLGRYRALQTCTNWEALLFAYRLPPRPMGRWAWPGPPRRAPNARGSGLAPASMAHPWGAAAPPGRAVIGRQDHRSLFTLALADYNCSPDPFRG